MTATEAPRRFAVRQYVEQYREASKALRENTPWANHGTPYSFQTTIIRILDNYKLAHIASLLVEEEQLERFIQATVRNQGQYPVHAVESATKVDLKIHEAIRAIRQEGE